MEYSHKKSWTERVISLLLVLSIVTSPFYASMFAQRAHAFWGIADTTVDVPHWVDRIIDGASMVLAQKMVDNIVASSVKWAQTGFEGGPSYVTDPQQFFTSVADGAAGEFIRGDKDLGFLCSPFQANIRLSLAQQYYQPASFQCTLTDVVDNIDNFLGDFNQGGWDAWFSMTQNSSNNPYGAFIGAKIELDSRIAERLNIEKTQLDWSQGFKGWAECLEYDNVYVGTSDGTTDEDFAQGECIKRGPTRTPGSAIKSQLDKVMSSGLDKLITAEHIDQLISGFASGLLNKYVFGSKGLFASRSRTAPGQSGTASASGSVSSRTSQLDIDGDSIPDGQDADRDGKLSSSNDVCFHSGRATAESPCIGSTDPRSARSHYFTPICEAIDEAALALTDFTKYMDAHADQIEGGSSLGGQVVGAILGGAVGVALTRSILGGGSADNFRNKADAELWGNRASEVDSTMGDLLNSIQSRKSPYFEKLEITANRFANYTGRILESLIKDNDLDLSSKIGSGGGGLEKILKNSSYFLRYIQEMKTQMGKCEAPDVSGLNAIATAPMDNSGGTSAPAQCPIPTTPASMCENVDRDTVLNILNKYEPSNPGIEEAIVEVKTVYPDAFIIPHDTGNRVLDKIDFGGGLIVDAIDCAGGTMAANQCVPKWSFGVECECGGPTEPNP